MRSLSLPSDSSQTSNKVKSTHTHKFKACASREHASEFACVLLQDWRAVTLRDRQVEWMLVLLRMSRCTSS
jgi:hypothetical protein